MAITYLFDHNVNRAVAEGLRRRGVDVCTAFEEGLHEHTDLDLLDEALARGRVLLTHDDDLLKIAAGRMRFRGRFHGVVYVRQDQMTIGQMVEDLQLLAEASEPEDVDGRVFYLPI